MKRERSANKAGYTLVEMVVAFALASVLLTALLTVIAPAYRMYARTRARADAQMVASNVLDTIRTTAMNASELSADGNTVYVGRRNAFTVADGQLLYNGVAVYDKKYYNGGEIAMTAEQAGENVVRVTVEASAKEAASVTATATIAPIRRILTDATDAIADPALKKAQQVVGGNPGGSADDLFSDLYNGGGGGASGGFAQTNVFTILSKARLEALKAAADANGTDEERALFADLLNKTFYTAVYFAAGTNQPIAYLTDVASSAQNAGNAVYFVYWEGNWYLRNPNVLDKKAMSEFDGLSAARIVNYLNAGVGFILAERVKLPLPTV